MARKNIYNVWNESKFVTRFFWSLKILNFLVIVTRSICLIIRTTNAIFERRIVRDNWYPETWQHFDLISYPVKQLEFEGGGQVLNLGMQQIIWAEEKPGGRRIQVHGNRCYNGLIDTGYFSSSPNWREREKERERSGAGKEILFQG